MIVTDISILLVTGSQEITVPKGSKFLTPFTENTGNDIYPSYSYFIPIVHGHMVDVQTRTIEIFKHYTIADTSTKVYGLQYLGTLIHNKDNYSIFLRLK